MTQTEFHDSPKAHPDEDCDGICCRNFVLTSDDCIDHRGEGCEGPIEYRMAMSPTGISYPRCEAAFSARLDTQERIVRDYGGQMDYTGYSPSWADEMEDY